MPHPTLPDRQIEIVPDPVHTFKNATFGWIKNKVIYLPEKFLELYELQSNVARVSYIVDLIVYEKNHSLKATSGLTENDIGILEGFADNFQKMRVKNSRKFINDNVGAALYYLSETEGCEEMKSTACWILFFSKWFEFITARQRSLAFSRHDEEAYQRRKEFFELFIEIVFNLKVGEEKIWKPWQSASITATQSILRMQARLIDEENFQFVLPGRFNTDAVENIIGCVRTKNKRPTPLQTKNALKCITMSQYLSDIPTGSYEDDEREHLLNFSEIVATELPVREEESVEIELQTWTGTVSDNFLDRHERNQLFKLAGYHLRKIKKRSCEECYNFCVQPAPNYASYARITRIKDFHGKNLVYVTHQTYIFFVQMEYIFRKNIQNIKKVNRGLIDIVHDLFRTIGFDPPICHNIKNIMARSFATHRIHISEQKQKKTRIFGNPSMV